MFQKPVDILTIGDMTVDSFIKLKNAKLHCKINDEECEICLPFGAKVPYEFTKIIYAAGGASNAAIAAARLGLKTSIISNLGRDIYGHESLSKLQHEKVITRFITEHANKQTNCNFVLWYEDDRTILVNHTEYDHSVKTLDPVDGKSPKWIYLTSLSTQSPVYEDALTQYLDARPEVKLAFQPGTYQISRGVDDLREFLKRTEVLIVNVEEAQSLLRVNDRDVKKLACDLVERGPKIVLITDGAKGSYMYEGEHHYQMPIFHDERKAVERTGCGDAFAATFISLLSLGRSPLEALVAAPVNAMSVAQFVGAHEGLLSLGQIDWFLERAPDEYKPRVI